MGGLCFLWQPSRADWLEQSSEAFWRRQECGEEKEQSGEPQGRGWGRTQNAGRLQCTGVEVGAGL